MRALQLIGSSMLLSAGIAQADVTGTVTAVSDYDFRGVSQTDEDPALQGSIDWEHASGWYASVWGSNVDFGPGYRSNVEVDGTVGYAKEAEGGLGWDVGLVYYSYWPDDDKINYPEMFAGVSYQKVDFKLWYSHDYIRSGEPSLYLEGNVRFDLPQDFGLKLHAGHYSGGGIEGEVGEAYMDYSVGIARTFGNFDLELKYVDTNIDATEVGDGRVILAVSTTFPWGKP